MQVTKEGVRAVLRHRKALLQSLACDLAPAVDPHLRMHDWVAGAGGPVFQTMVQQLYLDDQGLSDTLDVLCQSACNPWFNCILA